MLLKILTSIAREFFLFVFLRERERERACVRGRGREKGRERILNRAGPQEP